MNDGRWTVGIGGGVSTATEGSPALESATPVEGSSPPDSRDGETLGSGGCVAVGLYKLKVFPSVEEAKHRLNAQIRPFLNKCQDDGRHDTTIGYAGTRDVTWHPEVVKRAVCEEGRHFHKLDLASVDLRTELKRGDYLIDGMLNNCFEYSDDKRYDMDPDDTTDPRNDEAGWRHAIAVSNGEILENDFQMHVKYLWLDSNNRPDPHKGYMLKIHKVYRISECTASSVGCKGECAHPAHGDGPTKKKQKRPKTEVSNKKRCKTKVSNNNCDLPCKEIFGSKADLMRGFLGKWQD